MHGTEVVEWTFRICENLICFHIIKNIKASGIDDITNKRDEWLLSFLDHYFTQTVISWLRLIIIIIIIFNTLFDDTNISKHLQISIVNIAWRLLHFPNIILSIKSCLLIPLDLFTVPNVVAFASYYFSNVHKSMTNVPENYFHN